MNQIRDLIDTLKKKGFWKPICLALGLVLLFAAFSVGTRVYTKIQDANSINTQSFLHVKLSGYDTYGEAKITVDQDALKAELGKYKAAEGHTYSFKLSRDKNLSNDDIIFVRVFEDGKEITSSAVKNEIKKTESTESMAVTPSGEAQNTENTDNTGNTENVQTGSDAAESGTALTANTGSKTKASGFTFKDMAVKVQGLTEVKYYGKEDIYKGLTVKLVGASPQLSIRVSGDYDSDTAMYKYLTFKTDKTDHLACGDVVTITPVWDKTIGARLGFRFFDHALTYTIGQENAYIESADDLTQDQMQDLISSTSDAADKSGSITVDGKETSIDSISNIKLAGVQFLKLKQNDAVFGDTYNALYFYYQADVKTRETSTAPASTQKLYLCVKAANVIILAEDGSLDTNDLCIDKSSDQTKSLMGKTDAAYTTLDAAKAAAVNGLTDTYDVTDVSLDSRTSSKTSSAGSASAAASVASEADSDASVSIGTAPETTSSSKK